MLNEYQVLNVNDNTFVVGDNVRIQFLPTKYKEYPYSGGGVIGKIKDIIKNGCIIGNYYGDVIATLDNIFIIKKVGEDETFDNTPYINDEEREFWRTHWYTKDGIKEKTAEDIKMLEEFNKNF